MRIRHYLYILLTLLTTLPAMAEKPLVYVDAWQKSPYVFTNDEGEPDGFNVELIHAMMPRLGVPYVIELHNQDDAHAILKNGGADLSFGVAANYNASFGSFGKETICLFENAMLVRRSDSTSIVSIEQLKKKRITVREGSRALHYLTSHGVPDSMITVVDNMEVEILTELTEGRPSAVWNTLMLKWVLNKYHLTDEYTVQPIDIPAGEYRFMSNDTVLLARLDSLCRVMKEEGEIDRLVIKWMHPEEAEDSNTVVNIVVFSIIMSIALVILFILIHHYRKDRIANELTEVKSLMNLMLSASDVMVWVYYPLTRRYAWMTRDGKVEKYYTSYEFSKFFPSEDFTMLHSKVMEQLTDAMPSYDITIQTYDIKDLDKVLDVDVHIMPLHDDYGKIYLVCGTQHNITDSKASINRLRLLHARHQTAFNIAIGAILRFDAEGYCIDINERCCQRLGITNKQPIIDQRFNIHDFGLFEGIDLDNGPDDIKFCSHQGRKILSDYIPVNDVEVEGKTFEDFSLEGYFYTHVMKSYDKDGRLLGYMMYFHDITESTVLGHKLKYKRQQIQQMHDDAEQVLNRRNYTLQRGKIWMTHYYPDTKILEVYISDTKKVVSLTQLDILELVAEKDMKRVFKILHKVDSRERTDVRVTVGTLIRNTDHQLKHFEIIAHPVYNKRGEVESYFGIVKDVTRSLTVSDELKRETKKAREAEHVKQNFLKNMSYSIRQPLVAMQKSIEMLSHGVEPDQESHMYTSITANTRRLIMLSDDTLYLSRIEAGLLTEKKEAMDFTTLFSDAVNSVIKEYGTEAVNYNITDTYDTLPLMVDRNIMTRIIKEIMSLSSRYTHFGTINARYMFRKDIMTIAIEDTGQGIPPSSLKTIFEPRIGDAYTTEAHNKHLSGLEMPICKALIDMLHGTIEIESNPGRGTTIYVVLPIEEAKSLGQSSQVS